MGFFKKLFKETKRIGGRAINPRVALEDTGKLYGGAFNALVSGFAGEEPVDTSEADALADTEADKKRRLAAMSDLNPTGSLGTGSAKIKRPGVTGVSG